MGNFNSKDWLKIFFSCFTVLGTPFFYIPVAFYFVQIHNSLLIKLIIIFIAVEIIGAGIKLEYYKKLIKPKFHITFIMVILGAFLFAPAISPSLFLTLLFLYLSFNVLLYGGIYTLNDIIDVESDKKSLLKKTRPLPAGKK